MKEVTPGRLPPTFHETFVPERVHLSEILAFAAAELEGTKEDIREETGIPTGKCSGKVVPILRYAEGMGLLSSTRPRDHVFAPRLTPLGRVVFDQDPGLSTTCSQLLGHLHLCREVGGAEVWYQTFTAGFSRLGLEFAAGDLEAHLRQVGVEKLGPLGRMYDEPNSFGKLGALKSDGERFRRMPAPTAAYYAPAYAHVFLGLWEHHLGTERQLLAGQVEAATRFFAMAGWEPGLGQRVLDQLAELGAIALDRQLHDTAITRLGSPSDYLSTLYDGLP